MKKSLYSSVVIMGVMSFLGNTGHAMGLGIFAEPYLGYGLGGNASFNSSTGTSTDYASFNGVGVGARVGTDILGVAFGGADFSYYPSVSSTLSSTLTGLLPSGVTLSSSNNGLTRLGIVAGVSVPVLPLRGWLGFNFMDKWSSSTSTLSGTSFKLGVGFKFIPFVSVNAEYILSSYSSVTENGVTQNFTSGSSISTKMAMISVSVPLSL